MPIQGSTIVGGVAGVALLAGVVGFGVGLPELVGDGDETTSRSDLPKLPDRLDDRMVALSAVVPEDAGAKTAEDEKLVTQLAESARTSDLEASENLAELYDAATVRAYLDVEVMADTARQSAPAQMSVTVVPGDAGLVIPSGPFQINQDGSHYELEEINGHRCAAAWRDQVDPATGLPAEGQAPTAAAFQAECRAERDGLTYDVYSTGLTPEELADYLDVVLERTE